MKFIYKHAGWLALFSLVLALCLCIGTGDIESGTYFQTYKDSIGVDTDGDGSVDGYAYPAILKKGSGATLNLASNVITIGATGSGSVWDESGSTIVWYLSDSAVVFQDVGDTIIMRASDNSIMVLRASEIILDSDADETIVSTDTLYFGDASDSDFVVLFWCDSSDTGGVRFNADDKIFEYSNDNTTWYRWSSNADSIKGIVVSLQAPTDGQILKYSTDSNIYFPAADASGGTGWDWEDSAGEPPYWVDSSNYAKYSDTGNYIGDDSGRVFVTNRPDTITEGMVLNGGNISMASTETVDGRDLSEDEWIEDEWAAMLSGTQSGITVTYQDGTDDVDFEVDDDIINHTLDSGEVVTIAEDSGFAKTADISSTYETIANVAKIGDDTADFHKGWDTLQLLLDDTTNWNTAYGWGDHSAEIGETAGYLRGEMVDSSNVYISDTADALRSLIDLIGDDTAEYKIAYESSQVLSANYQPLNAVLTDISDGTINTDLDNTANPWADNEVANDITVSGYMDLDGDSSTGFYIFDSMWADQIGIGDHDTAAIAYDLHVHKRSTEARELVQTKSTTASHHARIEMKTETSGGDPYTTWTVRGARNWSMGIDNSETGDPLVIEMTDALNGSEQKAKFTDFGLTLDSLNVAECLTMADDTLYSLTDPSSGVKVYSYALYVDDAIYATRGYADSGSIDILDLHVQRNLSVGGGFAERKVTHELNLDYAYSVHADTFLNIPTSVWIGDGLGDTTLWEADSSCAMHPDRLILTNLSKHFGYEQFGFFSMIPTFGAIDSTKFEDVYFLVSQDGINWHDYIDSFNVGDYDTTANPIIDETWHMGATYLADPNGVYGGQDTIWVAYFVGVSDAKRSRIAMAYTTDCETWTHLDGSGDTLYIIDTTFAQNGMTYVNPIIIKTEDKYYCYLIYHQTYGAIDRTRFVVYESNYICSAYTFIDSTDGFIEIDNMKPWHFDVTNRGLDELIFTVMFSDSGSGSSPGDGSIYMASLYDYGDLDQLNWGDSSPVIGRNIGDGKHQNKFLYKPDLAWIDNGDGFIGDLLISGKDSNYYWNTQRTYLYLDDSTTYYARASDTIPISDINWDYEWWELRSKHGKNRPLSDSMYFSFDVESPDGNSTWLFTDSSGNIGGTRKDTINVTGYLPYAAIVDSVEIMYQVSTYAVIDSLCFKTGVGGLTDSLIFNSATDLTSAAWDTAAFAVSDYNAYASCRFSLAMVTSFTDDYESVKVAWIKMRAKR